MALFSSKPAAPAASDLRRERRALLLLLREDRLRELGGLTLEMYRRDHFNESLIVERCAELVAIEARASEIDALLQGARGLRRRGAAICACGAPILIGARFCPSCGRNLIDERSGRRGGTVTQCPRCGETVAAGQEYCLACGLRLPGASRLGAGARARPLGPRLRSSSPPWSPWLGGRRGDRRDAGRGDSDADRHGDGRQRGRRAAGRHRRARLERMAGGSCRPGRTSSSRFPRSRVATRRSPGPSTRDGAACDRSACSTRRGTRASTLATGWCSRASTRASPRPRAACGRQKACNGAPTPPASAADPLPQMAISGQVCNTRRKPIDSNERWACRLGTRLLTAFQGSEIHLMEDHVAYLQSCMYQYSRAIYRSIKDLIDPYSDHADAARVASQRALQECELTMSRLAADPQYFARPDRALFQDIRRYFPITAQAQVAWAVREGVSAAIVVHRAADRGRRLRRRHRPLQGDDAQGQGVPAHAAPQSRLLPVAPASRSAHVARGVRQTRLKPLVQRNAAARRSWGSTTGAVSSFHDVARRRQAHPPALARGLPDGGAPTADRA